jgi:peptidoglycan/LPS O-acetylase OafA/YrhL
MKNRYAFADGLRGLAALWVVLYHLLHGDHVSYLSKFLGNMISTIVFEYGNLGVPIFFVLSGFVMAVTTNGKSMKLANSAKFLIRRFIRLSPPYYFSIFLSLIALSVKIKYVDKSVEFPSIESIIAHLFYLQEFLNYKEINVVFWTLCYEIQFYVIFSLVIYLANKYQRDSFQDISILVFFTVLGLLWLWFHSSAGTMETYVNSHKLFLRYWYAFCAGALVAWTITRQNLIFNLYVISFYLLTLISGMILDNHFAIAAGLSALLLHLALHYKKMDSWLNLKYLQMLGLISYSLYLIHNTLLGIIARVVRKFLPPSVLTDIAVLIACLSVCIIVAYVMYQLIEKPVIRMSQKIKY